MSREAFEMVARAQFPELDLTLSPDGTYRAAQAEAWWTGWKLARGEMVRYLANSELVSSDIVDWGSYKKVGGTA